MASLESLQGLVERAGSLPLLPKVEESALQTDLKAAREVLVDLRQQFTTWQCSPLLQDSSIAFPLHGSFVDADGFAPFVTPAALQQHPGLKAFELEDQLSAAYHLPRKARFLEQSFLATMPGQSFLERPSAPSLLSTNTSSSTSVSSYAEVFQAIAASSGSLEHRKVSVHEVEKLFQRAASSSIKLFEPLYLRAVLQSAQGLETNVQFVLRVFQRRLRKIKGDEAKRPLSWALTVQLLALTHMYPLQLPSASALLDQLLKVHAWRQRVQELDVDTHAASDDASRRSNRTKNKQNSGNNINLMEIEALLKEAEHWPFAFPDEIAVLHRRKEQALEWISRFKQLFAKSTVSGRNKDKDENKDASSNGDGSSNKATLSELRMMINQGESMLGDSSEDAGNRAKRNQAKSLQKEMGKAQSAVEEAEDWIERFRELITSIFQSPCFISDLSQRAALSSSFSAETATAAAMDEGEKEGDAEVEDADRKASAQFDDVAFEEQLETQRVAMVEEVSAFLHEADDLPVVIEEAEVLKLQLQVLQWAQRARPLVLSALYPASSVLFSSASAHARVHRVRLNEFFAVKQEILR